MPSIQTQLEQLEVDYQEFLGEWTDRVEETLRGLEEQSASRQLWARHGSLWSSDKEVIEEIEDRLGWLDLPESMRIEVPRLKALLLELVERRMKRVVLLGMGGSSLAPEVLYHVFGVAPDALDLVVLDATDPAQIRRVEEAADLTETVFLAASKSGTTSETRTLLEYFASRLQTVVGDRWPEHFIAISDPGTPLTELASEEGFAAHYEATPDVGGRYSALTLFGLVPATLIGVDCDRLLRNARAMAVRCRAAVPEAQNTAVRLGAVMGALALAGRDKATLVTSPRLSSYGWWSEQLIAESTGKKGTGILPVAGEPQQPPDVYADDRLFAYIRYRGDDNASTDTLIDSVAAAGHPVVVVQLTDPYDVGGEFFRWEMATAIAGVVLGINPFDQPDVDAAKDEARKALAGYEQTGALDEAAPTLVEDGVALYGEPSATATDAVDYVAQFLRQTAPGDYVALMAYVDRTTEHTEVLQVMRRLLTGRLGVATTMGFGPRFLHSTGQFHKGGKNTGLYIQITQDDRQDLDIPGRGYSFGVLKSAQAAGDMSALVQRNRRVIRLHIGSDSARGLDRIRQLFAEAIG